MRIHVRDSDNRMLKYFTRCAFKQGSTTSSYNLSMKLLLLAGFVALYAFGQEATFSVHLSRWTNHNFPALIKPYMPLIPGDERDGVLVSVITKDSTRVDAVKITMRYSVNGKKFIREQIAFIGPEGCAPGPCRWGASVFEIGPNFEDAAVSATAAPIVWESKEVIAE